MKYIFFTLIIFLVVQCVPLQPTGSGNVITDQLVFDDFIYEPSIRSSRIYQSSASRTAATTPAVAELWQQGSLILEFDDLAEEADNYYARVVHCNADWTKSSLNDLEFMSGINEFLIDQYDFSFNTKTPYVHYQLRLPRVKLSGNYILVVFRGSDRDDLVLSKRFLVVDRAVEIGVKAAMSSGISERRTHQQVEFTINHGNHEILNPQRDIKVVIRQNQQWSNAITDLKPTLIRDDISQLIYEHFNLENNFMAGNEYRYFDLRSVTYAGINVNNIIQERGQLNAFLARDSPRRSAYSSYNDINGKYILENTDPNRTDLESEYVKVHFFLGMENPLEHDVYIMGELSNWAFNRENLMVYDSEIKGYRGSILLKQGWYSYLYYVPQAPNPFVLEGNHYETENQYEIIVYHRPIGARSDQIIGYRSFSFKN